MCCYLLRAICSVCILSLGADAEGCSKGILSKRESYHVMSGERRSLSCLVEHCGESYTFNWIWKNSTDDTTVSITKTNRHNLTKEEVTAYQTRHILDLERLTVLDGGFYGCMVKWSSGQIEQGHLTNVNVSAVVATKRKALHRILICFGVALFLTIILGFAFCLSSKVRPQSLHSKFNAMTSSRPTPRPSVEHRGRPHHQSSPQPQHQSTPEHQSAPQPLPRRNLPEKHSAPLRETPHQPDPKTEVVYADISQDALLRSQQRVRQSEPSSTVYSSVRFA